MLPQAIVFPAPPTYFGDALFQGFDSFYQHGVYSLLTNTAAQDVEAILQLLEKLASTIEIQDIAKSFTVPNFRSLIGTISVTLSKVKIESLSLDPATVIGIVGGHAVLSVPSASARITFDWVWSISQWGLSGSGSGSIDVTAASMNVVVGVNATLAGPPQV